MRECACCGCDLPTSSAVAIKPDDEPTAPPALVCWTCAVYEDFTAVLPAMRDVIDRERARVFPSGAPVPAGEQ